MLRLEKAPLIRRGDARLRSQGTEHEDGGDCGQDALSWSSGHAIFSRFVGLESSAF